MNKLIVMLLMMASNLCAMQDTPLSVSRNHSKISELRSLQHELREHAGRIDDGLCMLAGGFSFISLGCIVEKLSHMGAVPLVVGGAGITLAGVCRIAYFAQKRDRVRDEAEGLLAKMV